MPATMAGRRKKATKRRAPKAADGAAVSLAKYAEHRGVSQSAVRQAIQAGRLARSVAKDARGWYSIDVAAADREWTATLHRQRSDRPEGEGQPGKGRKPSMSLVDAKTLTEEAKAELEAIKLRQTRGELIEAEVVRREWRKLARELREAVIGQAPRIAPIVAAETDPNRCEILLEQALTEALEDIANAG